MFPYWEIISFNKKCMKQNFEIELLPDAVEFLENLGPKTRDKIYYNMRKA